MSATTAAMAKHDEGTPLHQWAVAHEPGEEMIYKNGYWDQIMFIRDRLSALFFGSYKEWEAHPVRVVGEHTSKSIRLPVFSIMIPGKLEVRLRANFHDYVVSVDSAAPVPDNFYDLFERSERQPLHSCEGFEPEWVFGPYANNNEQFSLRLGNEFQLYTFCYLLHAGLGLRDGLKP